MKTTHKRLTKKMFAEMSDNLRKLRRVDPIQFDALFNEWKRLRQGRL